MVGRMSCSAATAISTSLLESPRVALISRGTAITATSNPATRNFLFNFIRSSGSECCEQGHAAKNQHERQQDDEKRLAPAGAEPGLPAERRQERGPDVDQAEALGQR